MPRTIKPKKSTKKKTGRPSAYKTAYDVQAEEACKWGMDNVGLGKLFGVSRKAIGRWIKEQDSFCTAIKRGKYEYDTKAIVKSLQKKATGFEYDEVTEEFIKIDGKNYIEEKVKVPSKKHKDGKVIQAAYTETKLVEGVKTKIVHKMVVPSDLAIMFWLQNRQPDDWKNVKSVELSGPGGKPIETAITEGMSPEEAYGIYLDKIKNGSSKKKS